jgi:hypothetical protein
MHRQSNAPAVRTAWFVAVAALLVAGFFAFGAEFFDVYALDLGSVILPTPRYFIFVAMWSVLGAGATALLAAAMAREIRPGGSVAKLAGEWLALSDRRFLTWAMVIAFALPALIRFGLLHGAPLADDETAYHFSAELLSRGRLWVPSPPMKIFFDQVFLINDGRLYSCYFLGWPALLTVGVWLHLPGLVNPLLSALTVPALERSLRPFVGSAWSRAGVLLFLSSPFLQVAAATELSHTSCLFALAWTLHYCLRAGDSGSTRDHAMFGLSLATAFCIRPQSTVPLVLPLVIIWFVRLVRQPWKPMSRGVIAFAIPAGVLAVLFLGVLWLQNGSPFMVGYNKYNQYIAANDFRFTPFTRTELEAAVPGFNFLEVIGAMARTTSGMFRLNFDLFGWPSSFVFLIPAALAYSRKDRVLWAMVGSFLLLMSFQNDWGIDTFGPVHAFEFSLPVLLLTVVGAQRLHDHLSGGDETATAWISSPALLGALIVTAWVGFVPVRLDAVRRIADHVNVALRAPEQAGIHKAVIFSPLPFAPKCGLDPTHFVFFHPANDPWLQNDILWVNTLEDSVNRQFLQTIPDRPGYKLQWLRDCTVRLTPVER